ncbi:MAG: phosphorylase, partial [Flavobacteriaceae bacterium]
MKASELILNPDGSLYHLGLKPGDCAPLVITVGDPERVSTVAQHFDTVSYSHQTREIHTQTGMLSGRPISVISTGMGTDNIDIVINELDALFNMDLQTGSPLPAHTPLTFIRLGTSGAVQIDIPLDTIMVAKT